MGTTFTQKHGSEIITYCHRYRTSLKAAIPSCSQEVSHSHRKDIYIHYFFVNFFCAAIICSKSYFSASHPTQNIHEITTTVTLWLSKPKQLQACHAYNKNLLMNHCYSCRVTQSRSVTVHSNIRGYSTQGTQMVSPVQEEIILMI